MIAKLKFLSVLATAALLAMPQAYAQKTNQGTEEKDFVEEVVEKNNYEIALIQAALTNATDAEVKMHARHMLADHMKTDTVFRNYAFKNHIKLSGTAAPSHIDLHKKTGRAWDAEWAEEMVDKHRKVITMFEHALTYTMEPQLRTMINNTLPVLRSHLDMATKMKERLK